MYYHVVLQFPSSISVESNLTKEGATIAVSRFVNQQLDVHDFALGGKVIVNLSAVEGIQVFRTADKMDEDELFKRVRQEEFLKRNECTEDIIQDIRLSRAHYRVKSLLQQSFAEVEKQIFVLMKLGDKFLDSAYTGVIKPLGKEFGYKVVRVDEIQDSGRITDQVLDLIASSKIILADLSGERPNCYYEAGFAHALGREMIFTIQEGDEIHFDLQGYRFIRWSTEAELRRKLRQRLQAIQDRSQQIEPRNVDTGVLDRN